MSTEDAIVKHLGATPEQLIGYAYGGFLAVLISAIVEPQFVASLVTHLGGIMVAIMALAIGVGIYVLYFKVIGEFLLYLIQHQVHSFFDWVRKTPKEKRTSSVGYLGYLGVKLGYRRAAYEATKASLYDIETCRCMQVAHGELHVLYLTAVETGIAAGYLAAKSGEYAPWLWVAGVVYVAALIADTKQHFIEASMLRAYNTSELKKFLIERGYLNNAQE